MKHTITYTLPEESEDLRYAQQGVAYALVLHEVDQKLRGRLKHEPLTEEVAAALQDVRDYLHQCAQDRGVEV